METTQSMPRGLATGLWLTDVGFLLYWTIAALAQLGALSIPAEWMYANYERADVIAWNWSFFPLDLAFSFCGLRALSLAKRGERRWRPYALVSLILTMTAGGMACAYWTLLGEFDPFWYGTNAILVVWPLFYLRAFFDAPSAS